jgi:NADH-quinone oxidoreductase subunit A
VEANVPAITAWIPALLAILFGLGFAGLLVVVARALGPKVETAEKLAPFECGSEPIGSPRVRFSVRFYQIAILFMVFDIETAFMYPWAVLFRKLSCKDQAFDAAHNICQNGATSWLGIGAMAAFMAVLVVGLVYVWRKKVIGWD